MFRNPVKKIIPVLVMTVFLTLSLTGCAGQKASRYQGYVESLISANYIGSSEDYVNATGVDEAEAEAMYLQNISRLADNLNAYYGLDISGDTELAPKMVDTAKKIYSRIRFSVSPARRENNVWYVDVQIYPIDILNQTENDVQTYISGFNDRVAAGDYDNYEKSDYEHEFASGIIDILDKATDQMTYRTPEKVTVRIIETEDSYYIGNEDFRAIDEAVIATDPDAATGTDADTASPSDNTETGAPGN